MSPARCAAPVLSPPSLPAEASLRVSLRARGCEESFSEMRTKRSCKSRLTQAELRKRRPPTVQLPLTLKQAWSLTPNRMFPILISVGGCAMSHIISGAEPFRFESPGALTACLLLHGLTATPQEMRRLGEFLRDAGVTAQAPLLAGHGTSVHDLRLCTWHDWYDSAFRSWQELQAHFPHVFAIGLSLGGALALYLATKVHVSGVVAMATPLVLDDRALWLARLAKYITPFRRKGLSHLLDPIALAQRIAYDHTPTHSFEQTLLLCRALDDRLSQIQSPTLLIHSRLDRTVSPMDTQRIFDRLGTPNKRILWLENSGHILTEDYERQVIYDVILRFVRDHTPTQQTKEP